VPKNIVITGASAGIGAAAAELLARDGNNVALVARRKDALDVAVTRCGANAIGLVGDMSRREDVKRAVTGAIGRFGHVDVWINNVGQGISRPPSELTDEDIDGVVRVNVKSALYGMQEILPHFKARNAGHIINISSMLGRVPFAMIRSAYVGAKHFLNGLTATFREEVQATHPAIQVSLVSPGVVRTDFGINAIHGGIDSRQLPYSQSAEEVADVIAWVIASRVPDAYTRDGSRQRVLDYFASTGVDPDLS
jgi:NADP-dependent 3-hydroxy acid dehydrogenase YdfG